MQMWLWVAAFALMHLGKLLLFYVRISIMPVRGINAAYSAVSILLKTLIVSVPVAVAGPAWLSVFLYCGQLAYLWVNYHYSTTQGNYLSIQAFRSLFREGAKASWFIARGRVGRGPRQMLGFDLLMMIDAPFLIGVLMHDGESVRGTVLTVALGSIVVLTAVTIAAGVHLDKRGKVLARYPNDYVQKVRLFGLLGWQIIHLLDHRGPHAQLVLSVRKLTLPRRPVRRNIALVQMESIDASIVGRDHEGRPVMPYLHALRAQSWYFPYLLSFRGMGGTSDCELSVLNSAELPAHFDASVAARGSTFPNSLLRILAHHGYRSDVFHGNHKGFYDRLRVYMELGATTFNDRDAMRLREYVWGARDADVLNFAANFPEDGREWLRFVISMSTHAPFTFVNDYFRDARFNTVRDAVVRDYFNSCACLDAAVRDFCEKMIARGDTCVVLYGDHSSGLRTSEYAATQTVVDGEILGFTPLFIMLPDGSARWERENIVSFLDIAPTLLDLAGVGAAIATEGDVLVGEVDSRISRREISYRGHKIASDVMFRVLAADESGISMDQRGSVK